MDKDELKDVLLAIHELLQKNEFDTAMPLIYEVLDLYPNNAMALNFLGYVWLMADKPAIAYQMYRRALQEAPTNKVIWTSLGKACHEMDNFEDALKYFLKSAELDPTYALAYANASASLVQTSRWADAEKSANMALECDPKELNAQMNLAHCYFATGRWVDGWKQWDKSLGGKFRKEWVYGDEVRWDGTKDKIVIIYGEQGLGDEIFFGSCIPDAISISKKVYVDCDPKLENLFKRSFPQAEVHGTRREEHPRWLEDKVFDYRCGLGGLPEFFRKDNKDFPGTPYLVADPTRRTMWRALFDSWGKKVIGITTHGGIKQTNSKGREVPKECIEKLLKLKDYAIVSLDYKPTEKIEGVHYFPWATQSNDYDDTAALLAECDLVLGPNTTALNASAALGVKTWCLVPKYHQWRYAQPSMPWYRSMRLIYQDDRPWSEVYDSVITQL